MQVFVVGHDWGAIIAWYLCLFRLERVTVLVNTSVAFMDLSKVNECDAGVSGRPASCDLILFLQEPGVVEKEMPLAYARHLMTRILCNRVSEPPSLDAEPPLPARLTEADIDYFAAFKKAGFTGAINYYRNMDR